MCLHRRQGTSPVHLILRLLHSLLQVTVSNTQTWFGHRSLARQLQYTCFSSCGGVPDQIQPGLRQVSFSWLPCCSANSRWNCDLPQSRPLASSAGCKPVGKMLAGEMPELLLDRTELQISRGKSTRVGEMQDNGKDIGFVYSCPCNMRKESLSGIRNSTRTSEVLVLDALDAFRMERQCHQPRIDEISPFDRPRCTFVECDMKRCSITGLNTPSSLSRGVEDMSRGRNGGQLSSAFSALSALQVPKPRLLRTLGTAGVMNSLDRSRNDDLPRAAAAALYNAQVLGKSIQKSSEVVHIGIDLRFAYFSDLAASQADAVFAIHHRQKKSLP